MVDRKENLEKLQAALIDASVKCSERGLYHSAKWVSELAASLPLQFDDSFEDEDDTMERTDADLSVEPLDAMQSKLEARERHSYLLAKSYFDCREFDRCTAVFLPSQVSAGPPAIPPIATEKSKVPNNQAKNTGAAQNSNSQIKRKRLSEKALFLALYSKYLSGERRKEEATEAILGPSYKSSVTNQNLTSISKALKDYFGSVAPGQATTGWLEYLYGIVLAKGKNDADAKWWLIRSVSLCPFNWGAWLELSDLVNSVEELVEVTSELPENIMTMIFNLYTNQLLYQNSDRVWELLQGLDSLFPESQFLATQRALLLYHAKDLEGAEAAFSNILHKEPHRLDSIDHYSNILYVMGNKPKLAFLAQLALATDKFRAETCCVIGNYFSQHSEHEKAIQYFRRALMLDQNFLAAWTLMGHEYIELKNTHAAIESYRRAVDINRKDYRAWSGLGHTYELLEMHLYSLFYYQRASSLRPLDPQMWIAVATCYDRIGQPRQSIKAYQRALVAGTRNDSSTSFNSSGSSGTSPDAHVVAATCYNIACMYERLNEMNEAATNMERVLACEDGPDNEFDEDLAGNGTGVTMTSSKARIWLARYDLARGNLGRANQFANELCEDGIEVEEAKALIRDIRARMNSDG